ncbi:MAG: type I methionyl aminopeptidase [Candidatus Uhrbacteria bacterium]|nr:type I methionyl aminopeptidase [Candidatus Uhrbacteria bacterium]
MSLIKTPQEIEKLHRGGELLSNTLREIRRACVAGASTAALDKIARDRFAAAGGTPSFLGYRIGERGPAFSGAVCISINDEVVHGLPIPDRTILAGDVVGLDIGVWVEGLATDMATTVIVGETDPSVKNLVADTRESLVRGLAVIRAGKFVNDIGAAIEDYLTESGRSKKYGIVKDLVGHGVGHAVHEEPQIPNYRDPRLPKIKLQTGMVIAIEPMVTLGTWRVRVKDDGWTIVTDDGSMAAHFEVTVAVTDDGYDLITPWPDELAS